MSSNRASRAPERNPACWGIVLAGGEGLRPRPVVSITVHGGAGAWDALRSVRARAHHTPTHRRCPMLGPLREGFVLALGCLALLATATTELPPQAASGLLELQQCSC